MNLIYAYRLMVAAARQEDQRLPVTGHRDRKELQDMASAGLVEIRSGGPMPTPPSDSSD
jgi:hypothetical protein